MLHLTEYPEVSEQQNNNKNKQVFKKRMVFKEDLKELTDRNSMMDRNRELKPGNKRSIDQYIYVKGWYSEHLGVCRRLV